MPRPNEIREISELARAAESALQQIQNLIISQSHVAEARIRFPRGYLRTTNTAYLSLPEIGDNTKRRNLAYRLLMADMCRWLISRTDIYGQVRSLVVSEYICILAFGAEFFVKECTFGKVGRKRKFASHTEWLRQQGYLADDLKNEIDWLWEVRTREHLDASDDLDHDTYSVADFNRAQKAWEKLIVILRDNKDVIMRERYGDD